MNKLLNLMFACHRLPERSFFFRNRQFPICARCTGIFLGYIVGIVYAISFGEISLVIAALLIVPLGIDGVFQYYGFWKSTNVRRLVTGIFAGVGTDFVFYGIFRLGFVHGTKIIANSTDLTLNQLIVFL